MDRVTAEQRDAIRKTSSDRLRAKLEQAGWSPEDIEGLDRDKLMNAVADLYVIPTVAAASDVPTADTSAAKELELREREIALRELELQERQEERVSQERRWEEDRVTQERRWEAEVELRRAEYERLRYIDAEKAKQESSLTARTKKFADSVKHVFIKMSDDPAELPMFFAGVENLYRMYEIPDDLQAKLLLPLLTKKARLVVNRLSLTELDNYEIVKQRILREFRLTSREYLVRFRDAKKLPGESYVYFSSRLQNLLRYYLRSRQADSDPEKIIDVFVSDRLKESLSPSTLNYILSLEGDGTFPSDKVASTADIYVNNYTEDGKYRSVPRTEQPRTYFTSKTREHVSVATTPVGRSRIGNTVKPRARLCFECKSDQHVLANSPFKNVVRMNEQLPRVNACMSVDVPRAAHANTGEWQTDRSADDGPGDVISPNSPGGGPEAASVQSSVAVMPK